MHGTGSVIIGLTPVSAGATAGPTAFPCAVCRMAKYSPPEPPPVITTFAAQPFLLTTAEMVAGEAPGPLLPERFEPAFA